MRRCGSVRMAGSDENYRGMGRDWAEVIRASRTKTRGIYSEARSRWVGETPRASRRAVVEPWDSSSNIW